MWTDINPGNLRNKQFQTMSTGCNTEDLRDKCYDSKKKSSIIPFQPLQILKLYRILNYYVWKKFTALKNNYHENIFLNLTGVNLMNQYVYLKHIVKTSSNF